MSRDIDWFLINLDSRTDRLERMKAVLCKVGIQATRVPAATIKEAKSFELGTEPNDPRQPSPGSKACFMSHFTLLSAYSGTAPCVGILEDDADFCEDFHERLDYLLHNAPKDWDVLFLNAHFHTTPPRYWDNDFVFTGVDNIVKVFGLFCTHAYLVKTSSLSKVVQALDNSRARSFAYDKAFILTSRIINQYCFVPGMVDQIDTWSDITKNVDRKAEVFRRECGPHIFAKSKKDVLPSWQFFVEQNSD